MELVIGVDIGNSATKVVWYEGTTVGNNFIKTSEGCHSFASEYQTFYNLTQYKQSSNHFNSKTLLNNSGSVVAVDNIAYAVGTAMVGQIGVVHHKDYLKYSKEYYLPLLCAAIETVLSFNLDIEEKVDIHLFCTCQITGKSDVARWIKENATQLKTYQTLLHGNLVIRTIDIKTVEVYAEPVGTAIYFLSSTQNLPNKETDYIVLDFGGLTTDALKFTAIGNDRSSIRNVQFASRPYSCNALINEVRNILVTMLPQHYNERTPDHVIIHAIIEESTFASTLKVNREIKKTVRGFVETVIPSLEKELGGRLCEDYDKVIMTGGGASLLNGVFDNLENSVNINNGVDEFAYNNARGAVAIYNVVR